jgi:acyl transferase domain-containing protein
VTLEAFSGGAYMDKEHSEPIAIIGMSGRYAGAENLEQFWSNLCNAKNSIREIPISRWNLDEEFELMPQKRGKIPCRWIGLMDKAEYFDPLFFNISPSEAENMDPQQRIFLQEGYRAFEDAGYSPKSLDGMKCGVYLGIMSNDYAFMVEKNAGGSSDTTGNDNAIAAARISYFLNLKGPAIALDTACSSSMVAVHLASKALSDREIKMALVGGVTLYLNSQAYLAMCRAGMLSMDGKCRPFDKNANGFIPGEGVGALVLKRLSDAQADRDHIYGILKGSGVNQDGKTNGITAPSMQSQMELEKEVYNRYKISPESISYVEMHGTGTRLGDPIEMEALSTVFTEKTNKRHFCAIGSVKSNIGHSSAAAGIAGIQKVLLCLRHKQLVPTLNYSEPNSHFNLGTSPFYVNTVLREWKADTKEKRRAAVSSFGFSGTNAHVIIDEYPQEKEIFDGEAVQAQEEIFLLSAQSQEQLKAYAIKLKEFIISHNENSLENIAFTLQTGRDAFICRLAILADSRNSLIETLSRFIDDGMSTKIWLSSSGMRPSGLRTSSESGGIATQASTDTMIEKRMLPELGKLWVDGCSIDWAALPRRMKPYRVSLPTYPFAEEYCWVSSKPAGEKVVVNVGLPLENISDLYSVRYSSTFNGGEFYLRDHIVLKQKMLPAAVYLELIRNAYDQASQRNSPDQGVISITDVVWQRPTLVENVPVRLYTELCLGNDSSINFTISQRISDNDIVCCTGKVDRMPHSKPEVIDPRQIQFMCNEGKIGGEEFYKLFRAMGIEYGPAHQCIREINLAANQAIAAVEIPELLSDTQNAFGLHPSLMDSSLQSVLGLARDITAFEKSPVIPYALESLKVYKTLPQKLLVHARQRSLSGESEKLPGYDLDLLSESGELCCRLVGLSLRQFGGKAISGDTLSNFHENTPPDVSSPLQMIESTSRVDPRKEIITEHCVQYLIKLISDTLKIPKFKIDPTEPFSAFGIDSIVVVQLTAALSKSMENVTSNLFFQHQNILSLAEHLVNTQRDHITKIVDAPQKCPSIIESESRACQDTLPTDDAEAGRNSLIGSGVIRLQAQAAISKYQQSDIAVIGLAGRYAQSKNPAELWENLVKGKNCISEVPADRWNWREYFDPEIGKEGTTYTKWGGFIEDICRFDSLFFQISPAEAEKMDPQERAFLEIAFSAIDDAGYSPSSLCETKKVGVFVGAMNSSVPSGGFWSIANRVSFHFNFKGPSMAVDSACSSSLTAVHLAVESIKNGSCECALAGGVNLVVHPRQFLKLAAFRMVSATQECKAFGANADGFVDGEGVGAVVLKPLKKAVEDGDHIYGIIRASGINSGGKTNGYTVPNPNAQAELIAETLRNAGVSADAVSYIEAHGTGTPLGDPIEIAALTMAFDKFTKIKEFCAIGSIKSNIGHCESAAGIAGLTKVLLQLKHRKIVSSLHSSCLNPNINFSNSPFFVQQEVAEWKRPSMVVNGQTKEYPRIAGVSSFGAGGANAHLLVQEYASEDDEGLCRFSNQTPTVIVLSARTPEQLLQKKRDLLYSLRVNKHREKDLARIAYTLQVGREEMTERMGFIVSSIRELEARLEGTLISEGEMRQNPSGDAKQSKRELSQMCSDDDFIVLMESWFSKKKYDSLLGLWLKGFNVNWAKLYQAEHPKRISLPVYPFGGKRFNLQCLAKENQACLFDSQFDEQFFSEMLDGIALGTTSIEDAMRKTGAYFEKGHKVIQKG